MIPKTIHYIWFGGKPKPKIVQRCMESWKKQCPDYEIIEWTEKTFDVTAVPYMKEAYEAKKWAFASDVARLMLLYQYGGFYLDTDVELIRSLDSLRNYPCVLADVGYGINTGIGCGAKPGSPVIAVMLAEYSSRHFRKEDGTCNMTPCTTLNTGYFKAGGYVPGNQDIQMINGAVILPKDYLDPIDGPTSRLLITDRTIGIHHGTASWETGMTRLKAQMRMTIGLDRIAKMKAITHRILHPEQKQ